MLTNAQFEEVWDLLVNTFKSHEYSNKQHYLHKLHYDPRFQVFKYKNSDNQMIAFFSIWDLGEFVFVEHLAVNPKCRGKGIGTRIMKSFLESIHKQVVLEVEDPESVPEIEKKNAIRRISFYNRLGFYTNSERIVPPGKQKEETVYLLSTKGNIPKGEFMNYCKKISKVALL